MQQTTVVLSGPAKTELIVKKSRFIAELIPVSGRDEALEIIKQRKLEHSDASHVVYAFILGKSNSQIMGMSDDGEPKGTAGRPVLEILRGSGLTNTLCTVTRYFGGTKLGTGGLVKAYGNSIKAVLEKVSVIPLKEERQLSVDCSYEIHQAVVKAVFEQQGEIVGESFGVVVNLDVKVPKENFSKLAAVLRDLTRGETDLEKKEHE